MGTNDRVVFVVPAVKVVEEGSSSVVDQNVNEREMALTSRAGNQVKERIKSSHTGTVPYRAD